MTISPNAFAYYNKIPSHEGFSKEESQVRNAVDKFFGTQDGWFVVETKVSFLDGLIQKVKTAWDPDKSKANVFDELSRLGLMLCGGAVTSTFSNAHINDLDFYIKDESKLPEAKAFFKQWFPHEEMETTNAITYKRKSGKSSKKYTAQLITRFHGEAKEIFEWFDFTVTHAAYDFTTRQFVFGERFFPDLAKRRLVYSGASRYPICAMYRTSKYVKRGYELPGATIMHIALSIVQLKITNYKDLKEQLMGIDTIYLQRLLGAKEPDAPVNYGEFIYEAFNLIDRITGMTEAEEEDNESC